MRILGIDPGLAIVGWGVIDYDKAKIRPIAYGAIRTPQGIPTEDRLAMIYDGMNQLIEKYHPDEMSIEELFFTNNITTGIRVAEARGISLLAAKQANIPMQEYTPMQVKQAVVGYGRAEKKQVMDMVRRICNLPAPPKPDDAADAVALALCHARSATSLLNKGERDECSTI